MESIRIHKKLISVLIIILVLFVAGFVIAFFDQREGIVDFGGGKRRNPIVNIELEMAESLVTRYVGPNISTPGRMPIYSSQKRSLRDLAVDIAARLELSQAAFSGDVWVSSSGESLAMDNFNNILTYSVGVAVENGSRPTLEESIEAALVFLRKLELTGNLSSEPSVVNYYQGHEFAQATPATAEIIEMSFEQRLQGIVLAVDKFEFSNVNVLTTFENSVSKVIFPQKVLIGEIIGEEEVISFDEAVRRVERGQGQAIFARPSENTLVDINKLSDVLLSEASLEYRLSETDQRIYPYYKFTGVSSEKGTGIKTDIIVIHPAINIPN